MPQPVSSAQRQFLQLQPGPRLLEVAGGGEIGGDAGAVAIHGGKPVLLEGDAQCVVAVRDRGQGRTPGGRCRRELRVSGGEPQRTPARSHPAQVEWRPETVAGAAPFQSVEHVVDRFLSFAQDPIAVLAGDREPQQHHRLTVAHDCAQTTGVELARELQIDRHLASI